jgi:hypothetical protein
VLEKLKINLSQQVDFLAQNPYTVCYGFKHAIATTESERKRTSAKSFRSWY